MPKFNPNISPEDQKQIIDAGFDPADYLLEEETGKLVPKELGLADNAVEVGKGFLRGGADVVATLPGMVGKTADLIRQGMGTFDEKDPSGFTKLAEGIRGLAPEADPRAHWLASGGGEALGNLVGVVFPTAAGGRLLKAGEAGMKRFGLGLAGGQMGLDTAKQEEARQKRENEIPSPGKTALKAAVMGGLGAQAERFGVGKLLGDLNAPVVGKMGVAKRIPGNVLSGGAVEAGQQLGQDTIVEGQPDLENARRALVLGGLAQGVGGAGIDLSQMRMAPAEVPTSETGNTDSLKGNRETVDPEAQKAEEERKKARDLRVQAILRRHGMEEKPQLAIKDPVDDVVEKLRVAKVPIDEDMVNSLLDTWAGKPENVEAVQNKAREIQDKYTLERAPAPKKLLDVVDQQLDVNDRYDDTLKRIYTKAKAIKEAMPEMTFEQQALARAELLDLSKTEQGIIQQRQVELGAIEPAGKIETGVVQSTPPGVNVGDPATRVKVTKEPIAQGFNVPGQVTDTPVLDRGNLLPASTAPTPVPPNPAVVPNAIGPAIPMGTGQAASERAIQAPPVAELDPAAEAARIQREKEKQILTGEDENSGPFGNEPTIRYSGINPKTLLEPAKELARMARRWLTPDQVQNGTFMLSGVAGLNHERPWGMQVAGDGKLPVSGLAQKMAANIPKGEMEVYRAAGLEDWLKAKGKVGREELQQWMIENGPQVEVKELRPRIVENDILANWTSTQAQLAHAAENTGVNADDRHSPRIRDVYIFIDDENGNAYGRQRLPDGEYRTWASTAVAQLPGINEAIALIKHNKTWTPELQAQSDAQRRGVSDDATIGRYGVEPRPAKEMDGPVELLVRVPWGKHNPNNNTYDKIKWTGGHHGTSGQNTLGFGRANVETLPDGRRVLHVFEAQSDWGQRVRKEQQEGKANTPDHPLLPESNRLILKAAIKYAIDNNLDGVAISDGETAMITEGHDEAGSMVRRASPKDMDMHLEVGHVGRAEHPQDAYGDDWRDGTYVVVNNDLLRIDKPANNRFSSMPDRKKILAQELKDAGYGQKEGVYIPQEGGMRLNYDQKLPKIAKELTGFEGERVSFGEHWKTVGEDVEPQEVNHPIFGPTQQMVPVKKPKTNLVFKNPDGTFKTDITARLYSLDKIKKAFNDETAFTLFGADKSYYSGIPPHLLKNLGKSIATLLGGKDMKVGPNFFYRLGRSVTSAMAAKGQTGAYIKYLHDTMLGVERNKIQEILLADSRPFEKFLDSAEGSAWLDRSADNKSWDVSTLPAELRPIALQFVKMNRSIPDIFNSRGVYVSEVGPNGKITFRPHGKDDGYFPWQVGEQVLDADGDTFERVYAKDFINSWTKAFGKNSEAMAREAMRNILNGGSTRSGLKGQPSFGPVRLPQGVTLPKSWRSATPVESWNRYVRRVAQDLAWAEVIQYDPVMRRIMDEKTDPKGTDTYKTDPKTWADAPDAWAYAVREGRRVRAPWALTADPNKPPATPIGMFTDSKLWSAMLQSYEQSGATRPLSQATGSLASSLLMGTKSGTRDLTTAMVMSAVATDPVTMGQTFIHNILSPKEAILRAQKKGAMQGDMMAAEMVQDGKRLVRGLQKASKVARTVTGRNAFDAFGKSLIFDSVYNTIKSGKGQHLIDEFGPNLDKTMSLDEKARITAGRLVERYSNTSTAGNISEGMLPRSGTTRSVAFGLSRWGQGQWNNFSEDVIHKFLNDKSGVAGKRLLTLMVGSIVGGTVVNKLWEELERRKPRWLTWGEWFNVADDKGITSQKKAAELAYTAAAQMETIGALGTVGSIVMYPTIKLLADDQKSIRGVTELQYPAAIAALDWLDVSRSFWNSVQNGRADFGDLGEYMFELAKVAQNVRTGTAIAENLGLKDKPARQDTRSMAVYERVLGKDTRTGRPLAPEGGQQLAPVSDPFSFSRQVMGGEELGKFRPYLRARKAATGRIDPLNKWSQGRKYYDELERVIGEGEARRRKEEDRQMDREIEKKNTEIRRLAR